MNVSNRMYPFQEIPQAYSSQLEKIEDRYILSYYKYEEKDNDEANYHILRFLKQYKFITYQISDLINIQNIDQQKYLNVVICVEKQCLIIESINFKNLQSILPQKNSSYINISSSSSLLPQTEDDNLALEEVNSFRNFFKTTLKDNFFVNYTINPLISFIIRRNYYPTSYFTDNSFFEYKQTSQTSQIDDIFSIELFENQNNNSIEIFQESDFIKLRILDSSSTSIFNLVLHLKSYNVFVLKKYYKKNEKKSFHHEVDFCRKYSHIYLTPFYVFISSNGKDIEGFVYKFMSNGSLFNFMNKNNEMFRIKTLFCVFNAIYYLHSNGLIHRDIKPTNILIDNNENPCLSDFDQIRKAEISQEEPMTQGIGSPLFASPEQINGNNEISFPTDIYSFGKLIYYLYENKTYQSIEILPMENGSKEIQFLYEKCCQMNLQDRIKLEDIKSLIYFLVGKMFYEGELIEKNYVKSKKFFEISAKQNNSQSFYYLGKQYKEGQGVETDYSKAKYYFELSIKEDNNNSEALFEYGLLYYKSLGVSQDIGKAKQCFELSAKQNNSNALYFLGKIYYQGPDDIKNFEEALKYFELSAKMNNANAINGLGYLYYKGQGVPQDFKKCKEYIEQAVKLGDGFAINNLGYLYYEGIVVQRDYTKARQYYKLAAIEHKVPGAYYNLAKIYYYGNDVPIDYGLAKYYFQIAANAKHSDSYIFLGKMYKKGKGCQKSYEKAIECYEISAQNDNSDALFILGKMHYKGKEVEQNYIKAKYYFEKSSQKDNLDALLYLAKMYYEGKGVEQNFKRAKEYFELCSSKEKYASFFYLGLMYEKGDGVERDLNRSIYYYTKCAEIHDQNVIFSYDNNHGSYDKKIINENYYRSNNDLALIYFTEPDFKNIELAKEFLKKAALNEYPIGQNNYGTFFYYYENHIDNAIPMFEKASEYRFSLAEFNLGYIYEKENKMNDALSHYLKAIELENEPFKFKKQLIEDERLEISKTLIISFTYLKLALYYLNQEQKEMKNIISFIYNALLTPLLKLIIYSKNHSYIFTIKDNKNFIQEFILNFPLFRLSNEVNTSDFGWKENTFDSNLISVIIQGKEQYKDKDNKNTKEEYLNFIMKKNQNNEIKAEIDKILIKQDLKSKFKIIKNEEINEIKFISFNDNIERKLVLPDNLNDILFMDMNEIKEQIIETIKKLTQIIFTEPFSILFGRIGIFKSSQKIKSQDINNSFYEGFGV